MVGLLTRHPAIDRLITAKHHWYKNWEQIRLVKKRLKAFTPDLSFELEGTFRGGFAAWLSGAKYRVGFSKKSSRNFGWLFHNVRVSSQSSIPVEKLEQKMQLLETIGIMGSSIDYDLPVIHHEEETSLNICREHDLLGVPFAMIHVTEFLQKKGLHVQIADYLTAKWQIPLLAVWRNDQERYWAEELARDVRGVIEMTSELSIPLMVAMMRKALFFIGADLDTLHLASAVKTPCLGLLDSAKSFPPYQARRSCWLTPEDAADSGVFDTCDRMLHQLLPDDFQRRGA